MSCKRGHDLHSYALRALPSSEARSIEAHVATCWRCRELLDSLVPLVDSFSAWPIDVLRPSKSLWERLSQRIGATESFASAPSPSAVSERAEPDWEEVAPGISCKLLATDAEREVVSMLVRLAPGVAYPPHRHAGREELHLLDGELWIDERKLYPGEFSRADAGSSDARVWSETGCTCVLVTSPSDVLA